MRIGAVQTHDIQGDTPASLQAIHRFANQADEQHVDILCFPECFLQGYTLDPEKTNGRALDLASSEFKAILAALTGYKTTLIIGLIEKVGEKYYNTAAVIRYGELRGVYRKVHLFERNFQPGETYPIFTAGDTPFGINICYDARFSEGAAALASQDAKVLFYPLNNRLPIQKAENYRDKHLPNLVARAKETGCWVVSSDIIAQDKTSTSYGCTGIVTPQGTVAARVPELSEGMATVET